MYGTELFSKNSRFSTQEGTVEPDDSKPIDSKLLALVNFLPLTNSFIT